MIFRRTQVFILFAFAAAFALSISARPSAFAFTILASPSALANVTLAFAFISADSCFAFTSSICILFDHSASANLSLMEYHSHSFIRFLLG